MTNIRRGGLLCAWLLGAAVVLTGCDDAVHVEDDPYAEAALEFDAYSHWHNGRLAVEADRALHRAAGTRGYISATQTEHYPEYILLEIISAEGHTLPAGAPAHLMLQRTESEKDLQIAGAAAGEKYMAYHAQWMFYERSHENTDLATFLDIKDVPTKQDRPIYRKSEMNHIHINAFAPYVPLTSADVTEEKTILSTVTPWYVTGQSHLTALGVPTISDTDYLTAHLDPSDMPSAIEGSHLKLHLEHTMAKLNLRIGVTQDYSALREVRITGVSLKVNGALGDPKVLPLKKTAEKDYLSLGAPNAAAADQHVVAKPSTPSGTPPALPTDNEKYALLAEAYVKPSYDVNENAIAHTAGTPALVGNSTQLLITCTYDVYDNAGNALRVNLTAQNVIRMDRLTRVVSGTPQWLTKAPAAGHYYDIYLTLDPTYLYSLSDHDISPITIQ